MRQLWVVREGCAVEGTLLVQMDVGGRLCLFSVSLRPAAGVCVAFLRLKRQWQMADFSLRLAEQKHTYDLLNYYPLLPSEVAFTFLFLLHKDSASLLKTVALSHLQTATTNSSRVLLQPPVTLNQISCARSANNPFHVSALIACHTRPSASHDRSLQPSRFRLFRCRPVFRI